MTKRRRERDKPKSGPEALYNPNKRVLLSYASDEEETGDVVTDYAPDGAVVAVIDDRALANYQMEVYAESESEADVGATVDNDASALEQEHETIREDDVEDEDPYNAQGKANDDRGPPLRRDAATNQWPTLGPVSYGGDEDEDEEYDPETEEAMAYLEAVRIERQNIPEILAAPRHLLTNADHLQDPRNRGSRDCDVGDDGATDAKTQAVVSDLVATLADDEATNPQKVFTRLLLERFMEQRKQLHAPPSMLKLAQLPDSCPISFPRSNDRASAEWLRIISSMPPLPAQLRSMDQDSVQNLLALVQEQLLAKRTQVSNLTSTWIWSLLARLDDVGTMTNDEVFPIRELGKRAVFLLLSFTRPELAAGLQSLEQEGLSIAAAKSRQPQNASVAPPTENTLATLDMILVVIGEVFGQKDLLEFRPSWSAPANTT